MFHNELDLLEIRMEELWDIVDKFVITEATTTFQGDPKPMYYQENIDRFKKYQDKIIHYIVPNPLPKGRPFLSERIQRNYYQRVLEYNDNDILIIGDLDEMPKASTLKKYIGLLESGEQYLLLLYLSMHHYYVNYVHAEYKWMYGPTAVIGLALRSCPTSHYRKKVGMRKARGGVKVYDAGWHFSFVGKLDHIKEKIDACSYKSLVYTCLDSTDLITRINTGDSFLYDLSGALHSFKLTLNNDIELPKYLMDNKERFSHLFYQGDVK